MLVPRLFDKGILRTIRKTENQLIFDATEGQEVVELGGSEEVNYDDLPDKPSINGHVLVGNQSSEDLGIETGGRPHIYITGLESSSFNFYEAGSHNSTNKSIKISSDGQSIKDYILNDDFHPTRATAYLPCTIVCFYASDQYYIFEGNIIFRNDTGKLSYRFYGAGTYSNVTLPFTCNLSGQNTPAITIPEGDLILDDITETCNIYETTTKMS